MTLNEYMKRAQERPEWRPGLDAIAAQLEAVYGKNTFQYIDRASILDECEGVEGFGLVALPDGYMCIVTCGLTNLDASGDAYGNVLSGWGYELTVRWPGNSVESCYDAFALLNRLAAYTEIKKLRHRAWQVFSLGRLFPVLAVRSDSFAGVLFVEDAAIPSIDTVNGRVKFLQIVNLTAKELAKLRISRHLARQLAFNMAKLNPTLRIDTARIENYLAV